METLYMITQVLVKQSTVWSGKGGGKDVGGGASSDFKSLEFGAQGICHVYWDRLCKF